RLIGHLPVDHFDAPVRLEESLETGAGRFLLQLQGDARSVNRSLAVAASRASVYLAAMLAAIALAWLVIEIGLIRRIARLTKRTRGLSRSVHEAGDLARYELGDLRGRDELGLLAGALSDLLRRVREDADRESLRAAQEKEQWHAVGHEIMSPLQSLLALHGQPDDPSYRYISRMQQAIRVLYGSASPSEAISASRLQIQRVDLAAFLRHVAENAGIADLRWDFGPWADPAHGPLWVRADEFPLEDVFAHLLNNAERYRLPGTPIRLDLRVDATSVSLTLHNQGPGLAPGMADKIFEYGVSDAAPEEAGPRPGGRGQGLFVARTYLSKMGGSIRAENLDGGVSFIIGLQRSAGD
ncbi:MAG: sensor histidine kinase, partial [Zoogloea sp.]|uniref:sensor histidine kinase n=1 Tax=Zoogloea sp. TaxID=49181 RepID=UPI003F3A85C3